MYFFFFFLLLWPLQLSKVLLVSPSVMSNCLQPHKLLQHARLPCPSPSPGVCLNSCPLNQGCHPTILVSVSSPSPPALNLSQHQGLFQWVSSSYQVAKVLELQLQHQSFNEYSGLISFRIDWFDLLLSKGLTRALSKVLHCTVLWGSIV